MLNRLIAPLFRKAPRFFFCSSEVKAVTETTSVVAPEEDLSYRMDYDNVNLEDYRDLSSKIKKDSGYSLLQVEPFPRYKLMKISLMVLAGLRTKIPEDAMYRIYIGKCV